MKLLLIQVYYLNNWPPGRHFELSQDSDSESYLNVCTVALEILLEGVQTSLTNYIANFLRLQHSSEAMQMRINNDFPEMLFQRQWEG